MDNMMLSAMWWCLAKNRPVCWLNEYIGYTYKMEVLSDGFDIPMGQSNMFRVA